MLSEHTESVPKMIEAKQFIALCATLDLFRIDNAGCIEKIRLRLWVCCQNSISRVSVESGLPETYILTNHEFYFNVSGIFWLLTAGFV